MTQVSAPQVGEQFTDTSWRDLFGDEPGVVGDLNGTAYAISLPPDSDVARVGSANQDSLSRVAGFSHKIPAGQYEGVTIPVASGSARTDLIAVRYDPAFTDDPGPCRLARIAGTSTGLPAYDAAPPGIEDLPLWSITRQPGQALSQATVRQLFPRLAPTLTVPVGAPLPDSSPLGTHAYQGAQQFVRELGTSGVPVWAPIRTRVYRQISIPGAGRLDGRNNRDLATLTLPAMVGGYSFDVDGSAIVTAGSGSDGTLRLVTSLQPGVVVSSGHLTPGQDSATPAYRADVPDGRSVTVYLNHEVLVGSQTSYQDARHTFLQARVFPY